MKNLLIKTGIGPVLTKLPHHVPEGSEVIQSIEPLPHPRLDQGNQEDDKEPRLCWFDEMLGVHDASGEAGLCIPNAGDGRDDRPFLLIVSGPPGSAKSTFALQLCYNFARRQGKRETRERPAALYITTETTSQHIIDKASGFGWNEKVFCELKVGSDHAVLMKPTYKGEPASTCYVHPVAVPKGTTVPSDVAHTGANSIPTLDALENYAAKYHPEILVIDSFNTVPGFDDLSAKGEDHPITRLMDFCCNPNAMRPRLFILVLDIGSGENQLTKRFGFFADATIRFGMTLDDGGLLHRYVEITKVKSQKHAEGIHAIQIFKKPLPVHQCETSPFLKDGGLFVYPSIQWYLDHVREFKSIRNGHISQLQPFPILPEDTGRIISPSNRKLRGFVPGHTISLVGRQNILKTRFAYACLLKNVIEKNRSGLIVSLDSDLDVVTNILAGVVETEFEDALKKFENEYDKVKLAELKNAEPDALKHQLAIEFVHNLFYRDQISFIHNEPAYITPGEFFHRVYVAFKRPRKDSKDLSITVPRVGFVVVDGLDQIETKFPLCAKEKLFVSALVTLFKTDKNACAVFISSQDPLDHSTAMSSAAALIPLSDLLLRFETPSDLNEAREKIKNLAPGAKDETDIARICTIVYALRVPFGVNSEPKGTLWTNQGGKLRFNIPGPYDDSNSDQVGMID